MSAMSELKLQQAALERENLELRSSQLNNNSVVLPPRRPPAVPARSMTTTPIHGSHSSLQQVSSSGTPKVGLLHFHLAMKNAINMYYSQTPPSTYRRQVDLHYSSLPRQAFPTSVNLQHSETSGSSPSVALPAPTASTTNGNQAPIDSNANPTPKQRNVAFGKHFQPLCPSSASQSASNVYHHQLVLFQHHQRQQQQQQQSQYYPSLHQIPLSSSSSSGLTGYHSLRGYSVPNLGGFVFSI